MEWIVATVVVLIPLLVSILAVVFYRGFFRVGAIFTLPLTAFASLADAYSASQKGNLTGLFTVLISGPSLLVLLLLGVGEVLTRWRNRSKSSMHPELASDKEMHLGKGRRERSLVVTTATSALSGALLVVSGLILVAIFSRIVGFGAALRHVTWLRTTSALYLVWPIGAVIGAIGGAGAAIVHERQEAKRARIPFENM